MILFYVRPRGRKFCPREWNEARWIWEDGDGRQLKPAGSYAQACLGKPQSTVFFNGRATEQKILFFLRKREKKTPSRSKH